MFFRLGDLITKRIENLGLLKRIDQEKRIIFLKKELKSIYETDPIKEAYFQSKEVLVVKVENFVFLQDIQMRKSELIEIINKRFPEEKIKEIRTRIN
jgi:hypothetical protein